MCGRFDQAGVTHASSDRTRKAHGKSFGSFFIGTTWHCLTQGGRHDSHPYPDKVAIQLTDLARALAQGLQLLALDRIEDRAYHTGVSRVTVTCDTGAGSTTAIVYSGRRPREKVVRTPLSWCEARRLQRLHAARPLTFCAAPTE